ncbi:MAG: four helix bundle protein [bacterium]
MIERPYHKIFAWQKAKRFVTEVYRATERFPKEERYGIVSQLRRAALSAMLNIAEGQARGSTKDYIRFLYMSRGSLSECM